VHSLSQY